LSAQVELIACATCGGAERDAQGQTRGERLLRQLEAVHAADLAGSTVGSARSPNEAERAAAPRVHDEALRPGDPVRGSAGVTLSLSSVRCLWACKRSCAVHLRAAERAGYVLVELEPTEQTARALLDYAKLVGQSSDGSVPFKQWPDPLRGHFLCRLPAMPSQPASAAPNEPRDRNQ
jgi:predicted metal-binding protein